GAQGGGGGGRRAVPGPTASAPAPVAPVLRSAPRALRRRRRRAAARLDQRDRPRALPHGVEPLRAVRQADARRPDLPPARVLRVLGARRLRRADRALPVVAPGDA